MELKTTVKTITSAEDASRIFRDVLKTESAIDQDKEHFWVLGLTTSNSVKYLELVTLGLLNQVNTHAREVFRSAITHGVNSIIIAHNHPSGSIEPSGEDRRITKTLTEAGKIIGIEVLDHLIITSEQYNSLLQEQTGNIERG